MRRRGPPMSAPCIIGGPNAARPGSMSSGAFRLLAVVERTEKSSFAAALTASNCFCPCSRTLGGTEASKAIRRVHLADGLLVDALARSPSSRGRGVLSRLGVLAPGWSQPTPCQAPSSACRSAPGRQTPIRAHNALHHSSSPIPLPMCSIIPGPMPPRPWPCMNGGPKPPWPCGRLREGTAARESGGDRETADHESFLVHGRLQSLRYERSVAERIGEAEFTEVFQKQGFL